MQRVTHENRVTHLRRGEVRRRAALLFALALVTLTSIVPSLITPIAEAVGTTTQAHYRWYGNRNNVNPANNASLAAEDAAHSGIIAGDTVRLRMNMKVNGSALGAGSTQFKLQYAESTSGPWSDVGSVNDGVIWRGIDNTRGADGDPITVFRLNDSDVFETYQENQPSVANPNAISNNSFGEWDWVLQHYLANGSTTYYFRMVESNGTALDAYASYPQITTAAGPVLTQADYRWFENLDNKNPTTALAAENTAYASAQSATAYHLRMNVSVTNAQLQGDIFEFKLQYSTATTTGWTDVGDIGSSEVWRGYDNPGVADEVNVNAGNQEISTSETSQSYEEENPSKPSPRNANVGEETEWAWILENNNAPELTTYYFRMIPTTGAEFDGYTNFPTIATAAATVTQNTFRWYSNADSTTPGSALAAEDTTYTSVDSGDELRLRTSLLHGNSALPTGQKYRLQFATTTTAGPWAEVGAPTSSTPWRFNDNATPSSGATVPSVLLPTSAVAQSYQEANPSAGTPNLAKAGTSNDSEWDWSITPINATGGTTYYFRMIHTNGDALDGYNSYPSITIAAAGLTQETYRWYENVDATQPTTAVESENSIYSGATSGEVLQLRMALSANAPYSAGATFKLQYSTSTSSGPWADVGGVGSSDIWRGYDNATPSDGATVTTALLTGATKLQTYEEANPSSAAPSQMSFGNDGEWGWTLHNNGTATSTTYFFRMAFSSGTPLAGYDEYPRVFTVDPGVVNTTQDTYRWYQNSDFLTPSSELADEGTGLTDATDGTVYRLRMSMHVNGSTMNSGETFRLQFATSSTAGPWADVGAIASVSPWRFSNNVSVADDTTLTTLKLTESDVAATYQESNPSAGTPTNVTDGQRAEWDWVVENNGASGEATYYFRMVTGAGAALTVYNLYPTVTTASPKLNQSLYRWYSNTDAMQPTAALASENTGVSGIAELQGIRLRFALSGSDSPVLSGKLFKLQYSTSQAGPWTDTVGPASTAAVWRGVDNASVADGASVTSNLLSSGTLTGTYEESNPTPSTSESIDPGDAMEFDFVLESNGVDELTTYYFRVAESDDTVLDFYSVYPEITTGEAGVPFVTMDHYHWYNNTDSADPTGSSMAAEDTGASGATFRDVYRLRANATPTGASIQGGEKFKLQYAPSQSGPWDDVGLPDDLTTLWRGFDNASVADGVAIPSQALTGTNTDGTYEEFAPTTGVDSSFGTAKENPLAAGDTMEWDWVIQDNGAAGDTTYYFRMVYNNGVAFNSYPNLAALTTVSPSITQASYRWYANEDSLTPSSSLAQENATSTGVTSGQLLRLRVGLHATSSAGVIGSKFRLQYSTSTTSGPWAEVGQAASSTPWRGYVSNPSLTDGDTLPSNLLSNADTFESYEAGNPSIGAIDVIKVNSTGQSEWDYVIQENATTAGTEYFFRLVTSAGNALGTYSQYPAVSTAAAGAPVLNQNRYRWYENTDVQTPTTALAAENTSYTSSTSNTVHRLRIGVDVSNNSVASGEIYKLQFATNTGGPWTEFGRFSSSTAWRGYNNASVADGSTLSGTLLSTATVTQTYEEQNASFNTPNTIPASGVGEWDWAIQNNGAVAETTYYFRMVKNSGAPIDSYGALAEIKTLPTNRDQVVYRWYTNINNVQPTPALAAENTGVSNVAASGAFLRLRLGMDVSDSPLATSTTLKLQYGSGVSCPSSCIWSDVGADGSGEIWRGNASQNGGVSDGAVITSALVTGTNVLQTYEEQNDVTTVLYVPASNRTEWDWMLETNGLAAAETYYFRLVQTDSTPLEAYTQYATASTSGSQTLTQEDYRWYVNNGLVTPVTALAIENTAISGAIHGTVYRIRMNIRGGGTIQPGEQFKLQFSNTTTSGWTDLGDFGGGELWRAYDNVSVTDGTELPSVLLTDSDIARVQTYEEENLTAATPNQFRNNQQSEFDWVVQANDIEGGVTYYFRIVHDNGAALDGYETYPTITGAATTLNQAKYRLYLNVDSTTPGAALAAEDTAAVDVADAQVVRMRIAIGTTQTALASGASYTLQYSTTTSAGPWADVGGISSNRSWRGYDNSTPVDGATLSVTQLTGSATNETYEETNPSANTPNTVSIGATNRGEWDWGVENNGADGSTVYFFRMVYASSSPLTTYSVYPSLTTADPASSVLTQDEYRWYANADSVDTITAAALENTVLSSQTEGSTHRLRMNLNITNAALPTAHEFKLQYATSTGGPWMEVGQFTSSTDWRGYNNTSTTDGAALTQAKLTNTSAFETFEESNPSATTPNSIAISGYGEWDWVLKNNGAAGDESYYFRMIYASSTPLDSYVRYPTLSTTAPTLSQNGFRVYQNTNAVQPTTALAVEDTNALGVNLNDVLRLRTKITASNAPLKKGAQFKLQFATNTGGPWTDVGGIGSGANWRGYNNASVSDGTTISSTLLTGSTVNASYEESNNTVGLDAKAATDSVIEFDWVVENQGGLGTTIYYFRMVYANGTVLSNYPNYVQITTTSGASDPSLTQEQYRWYQNVDSSQPTTSLTGQNTTLTNATQGTIYRLRMNIGVANQNLGSGSLFKSQFATSTGGPWTDVGNTAASTAWRGYNNASVADGVTIPSTLLTLSNVKATYEETNSSVGTPFAVSPSQYGEWDWVLEANAPDPGTTYYFRMIRDNSVALEAYTRYPTISTATGTQTQKSFRFYDNNNANTPTSTIAAEDTAITGNASGDVVRIRLGVETSGNSIPAGEIYKLQFSATTTGGWADLGGLVSGTVWRGYNNASVTDGVDIDFKLLSNSQIRQTYEETNPSASSPRATHVGTTELSEWDWVIENNSANVNTKYYFRMIKNSGSELEVYDIYPAITTVNTTPNDPSALGPGSYIDNSTGWITDGTPTFNFSIFDSDANQQVQYQIQIATDSGFSSIVVDFTSDLSAQGSTSYTVGQSGGVYSTGSVSMTLSDTASGYYWRVRSIDEGVAQSAYSVAGVGGTIDIRVDATAPVAGTANDSLGSDTEYNDGSMTSMSANWSGFSDVTSGLDIYKYSIGSTPGGTDQFYWTSTAMSTSVTNLTLNLHTGQSYYFNVQAFDIAGNTSTVVSTDGQAVLPILHVTSSATTIDMGHFNDGGSNTATSTFSITVTTNAYHGYEVKVYTTDFLRSTSNGAVIIPNFAGTYASPQLWTGTGWGYNTTDCDVNGAAFWTSPSCAGSPKYAAFSQTPTGDVIADHTALILGDTGPANNEQYTLTLRATTAVTREDSVYTTGIVIAVIPSF